MCICEHMCTYIYEVSYMNWSLFAMIIGLCTYVHPVSTPEHTSPFTAAAVAMTHTSTYIVDILRIK